MEIFQNRRAVTQTQTIALVAILIVAVTAAGYYISQKASTPTDTELGVSLLSQTSCEENQTCYLVSVDCEGLALREAEIRVYHNPDSKGGVIFVSGAWGRSWYGGGGENSIQTVNVMQDEGYETYEIRWLGERGWGTDNFGQGFKKLSCGFAKLVQWIVTNVANNPENVGATGHSGGANEIAYGLALHELENILDVVVLTGGPARSNLIDLCNIEGWPGVKELVDYVMGWLDNGNYCQTGQFPEEIEHALQAESIVSPLTNETRDYHYPNTQVVFVEGELDVVTNNGRIFYDTITSEKSWFVLTGVGHGIPNDSSGSTTIQEMLLDGLEGQ